MSKTFASKFPELYTLDLSENILNEKIITEVCNYVSLPAVHIATLDFTSIFFIIYNYKDCKIDNNLFEIFMKNMEKSDHSIETLIFSSKN